MNALFLRVVVTEFNITKSKIESEYETSHKRVWLNIYVSMNTI